MLVEFKSRQQRRIFMASSYFFFLLRAVVVACICFSVSLADTLLLPLTHSLSRTHFNSTHDLLKSTSSRSAARFSHHHHHHHDHVSGTTIPLSPGSDYTLSITVASQSVSLYMDTGSDLVWVPCSPFTCILCEGKPRPHHSVLNLSAMAVPAPEVSCQSAACSAAHSPLSSSSDLCAVASCPLDSIEMSECSSYSCPPFYYAYGDGSFIARLLQHTVSIPMSSPPLTLSNFTFGCANSALGEPVGVAGFGRGVLSLPSQLSRLSPQLGTTFSYCLVSHSFGSDRVQEPSPLILGQERSEWSEFVFAPILNNPTHPYFYTVGLAGVLVGKRNIPAPEILRRVDARGNGGMVVDSGTTFTMLPARFYNSIVSEFDRQLSRAHKRAANVEKKTGLAPCYDMDDDGAGDVPEMMLRFVGSEGSDVALPRSNYFYEFRDGGSGDVVWPERRVGCLMLMNGGGDAELDGGPAATLGNYQQQGFEVVYDLGEKRVGFARRHCASLWDSLRQR